MSTYPEGFNANNVRIAASHPETRGTVEKILAGTCTCIDDLRRAHAEAVTRRAAAQELLEKQEAIVAKFAEDLTQWEERRAEIERILADTAPRGEFLA